MMTMGGRRIQNIKPEYIHEFESHSKKEQGEMPNQKPKRISEPLKAFPLSVVLKACPQIADYTPASRIEGRRGLMAAA
ncbi:hypothetical protein [Shinella sp.]|uniref:hypothetical protein n=1 Tax=Shinella sp. TaxID=1870904 RepID=UPI003F70F21D